MRSFLALIILSFPSLWASTPGGNKVEGPAGNTWKAEVIEVLNVQGQEMIKLKLIQLIGSCKFESNEGKIDQVLLVTAPTKVKISFRIKDVVKVWLSPDSKATLEIPKCW